jgi:hypothetical protein
LPVSSTAVVGLDTAEGAEGGLLASTGGTGAEVADRAPVTVGYETFSLAAVKRVGGEVFSDVGASITPVSKPSAGSTSIAVPASPLPCVDFRIGTVGIGLAAFFGRGRGRGIAVTATSLKLDRVAADMGAVDTGAGTGNMGAGNTGAGGDPVGGVAANTDDVAAVAVLALTGFFALRFSVPIFCFLGA